MTPNLEISTLIKPVVDTFKMISNEWKNFFEIGFEEYLHSQTEKYYFTNTFLHRSEKVRFNDIYYPIQVKHKNLVTDFIDFEDIFSEHKKITIVGSAGSGKSTLIKHIFLSALATRNKIPILVELRHLNEYNGDLEKLIQEKIIKTNIKPSNEILKRALNSGDFLILLDGYDEIFSEKKQEITRQIDWFTDSYHKNYFLITTRPGSGIESFSRFTDFSVCSLDNDDVIAFIDKLINDSEKKRRLTSIVKDPKNNSYFEYLRNPLLLSMFIMASETHPEIPTRKSAFYRNVFDTLYSKHDGVTKNSFPRQKLSGLERDSFENILSVFSYIETLKGQFTFVYEELYDSLNRVKKFSNLNYDTDCLITDLRTTISILTLDGFEYYFPHRSLQEYFTALFISKINFDKKIRAYNNLSRMLETSSNDYSFNFWSLCYELDENSFIQNYLIPQLEKILETIKKPSRKQRFNSFMKIINPVIFKEENNKFFIARHASFQYSMMNFCEIFDYNIIGHFIENKNLNDKFIEIFNEESILATHLFFKDSSKIRQCLFDNNFNEIIDSIIENLEKKIQLWNEKIIYDQDNIENLLNL